jgi:capsular polysaccharide biosynthesis protein
VPSEPYFPNRPLFALVGLGIGLFLGWVTAVAFELRDHTVKSAEDLQALLPQTLLAEIPLVRVRRRERHA